MGRVMPEAVQDTRYFSPLGSGRRTEETTDEHRAWRKGNFEELEMELWQTDLDLSLGTLEVVPCQEWQKLAAFHYED
ncbi:uncharacterized protein CCOS01_10782 [Colletotrichum costaricense]|uniref:Uncharacterized protein n=1 Tax=Colletotrichum costaricense TaxID=1209916 RepID=A0AAI9YSI6_9PEZI|nr:uncharacterized protein CCOS01_10782 [Colletotrichum costaricense]KAK1520663.1 hypothetical protein CCOS01_10782 [Colletotrichum costaricense]